MKKYASGMLCLVLSILILLPGCSRKEQKRYQAEFLLLFDTVTTIVGYAESEESFSVLASEAKDLIEQYHQLYDIYNSYDGVNNLKTINDNAGNEPVKVDRRIIDMLSFAREQYDVSGGRMNVAMGAVLSVWHDYRGRGIDDPENAELPPSSLLLEASKHMNIDDMVIDTDASTVYLRDPLMSLDVGSVAKGYAAEQVMRHFERKGVTSLLLSIGGNVRAIGGKPGATSNETVNWTVGIQNPDKSSSETDLFLVGIWGISVISSGVYERYYVVDGKQYHHLIDPSTLMPSNRFSQVTIICRDSGVGDALSTAVFNMTLEEGLSLISSMEGAEAAWVMNDGSVKYSDGFKAYLNK